MLSRTHRNPRKHVVLGHFPPAWAAVSLILVLIFAPRRPYAASSPSGPQSAIHTTVTYLKGIARIRLEGQQAYRSLRLGQRISRPATVVTLDDSRAEFRFSTGQIVRMGTRSTLVIGRPRASPLGGLVCALQALRGRLWLTLLRLPPDSEVRMRAGDVMVGVKGTVFRVDVTEDGVSELFVYDGLVTATRPNQDVFEVARLHTAFVPKVGLPRVSSFDEKFDEMDAWVRWNKERDRLRVLIVMPETHDRLPSPLAFAEHAITAAFIKNYYFTVIDAERRALLKEEKVVAAAARGREIAAADIGADLGADLVIIGNAIAETRPPKIAVKRVSAKAQLIARAVMTDTAEVVAAYVSPKTHSRTALTDLAAIDRALSTEAKKAASAFIDSILMRRAREAATGSDITVVIQGGAPEDIEALTERIGLLPDVRSVGRTVVIGNVAHLIVTYPGGGALLAEDVSASTRKALRVEVVGFSAARLELEIQP